MSPPERIDALVAGDPPEPDEQRLARVIYELQAARPAAPEGLRDRIDALSSAQHARRPSLLERLTLRRALVVLAPAVVLVSLGAAVVQGVVTATSPAETPQRLTQPNVSAEMMEESRRAGEDETDSNLRARSRAPMPPIFATPNSAANRALPRASPGRTQDYYADLRLRVDDLDTLSDRMQEALRLTRRYGGYVVSTSYRNPRAGEGDAALELRVPIARVQEALVAFSELGAIVSQSVTIRDLQGEIDRHTRDIRRLRDRMAALRASLLDPDLTAAGRARIEEQLAQVRSRLLALEQERRLLARQGRFAKISLALTTEKPTAKAETPGRIERAVDDAGAVLAKEVAFGLYALIVASPFLLLIALTLMGARAGRRRADQRLLERA
jgi:Domain of unknown function (DUF4349)